MDKAETDNDYVWSFFRAGRLDQVLLRNPEDLSRLEELDQKLWVALSCPTRGVEFDTRTLDLIDTDKDERIRVPELLAALRWVRERLTSLDCLVTGGTELALDKIAPTGDHGPRLLAGARQVLEVLGKGDAASLSLADIANTAAIFARARYNGDGIVPADIAHEEETQSLAQQIIATLGGETDRSGKPGVNAAKVAAFFAQAQAYLTWLSQPTQNPSALPLGEATAAACAATAAVADKIEDFFARGSLAAFDARATIPLNRAESEYTAIADRQLTVGIEEIAALPLAQVQPDGALPLGAGVNPAWARRIAAFREAAVKPIVGDQETLSAAEWTTIEATLAPARAWMAAKPATPVEALGQERLQAILDSDGKVRLFELIAEDEKLRGEFETLGDLEQLLLYQRDLYRLLHNYVNLADFYSRKSLAIFQVGRLYMDGRSCDLCLDVDDPGKHSTMAEPGKVMLAYCALERKATGEKKTICAAFTHGLAGTLYVGRNGIFYDRQGRDWEAMIIKILENPISLREAFWMPWKKLTAMIAEQVKKLLSAREASVTSAAGAQIDQAGAGVAAGTPPAPPKMDGAALASSVAAVGIAVGLMGAAVAGLVGVISGLPMWKTLLGVLAVILLVSGPSVILAYFKLRARDLGPILNACGWAVNGRIRLTLALGKVLTRQARVPLNADRQLSDPYAEKNTGRNLLIALLIVAAVLFGLWRFDFLDDYLPVRWQHNPPALVEPATPAPAETPAS